MQRNPGQRLVRLQSQSVTTEDSPFSPLAAQSSASPTVQREGQPASPSSVSTTSENLNMAGTPPHQPLTIEDMLMNLQNSFVTMQQRSYQTDANITRLNDLINTRLPPPLEDEGEDDEDDQEQPIMIPDPNSLGRNVPIANPDIAALTAMMAQLEESIAKAEKVKAGGIDLDRLYLYPNARLPEKFKMPDLAKFDGSGDPRTHLYSYHAAMKLLAVEPGAMSQLFPQTLSGPAFHWFLSLDIAKKRTWEDIGPAFISQYSYNS
ncbi:hypothetical protein RHMOL_Rhmol08G0153100 [Rhododendron molle]|uniref:Uncharacterized protein n=1 Tax=Rhododendron molle TaxID=49168 RepID=A0ACC0MNL0_RHOML|nr:hypothetical protein RHMOL_Rhmol08G0153100 [Rhododendron molle]